jgi:hypothetical protein
MDRVVEGYRETAVVSCVHNIGFEVHSVKVRSGAVLRLSTVAAV